MKLYALKLKGTDKLLGFNREDEFRKFLDSLVLKNNIKYKISYI